MVEVTTRTLQSRFLLRPSRELNAAILAVLGRALHLYDVQLHVFAVLSNHVHLVVSPADGQELARFMQFVNCNISGAVGRLHDWRGALWERRYRSIPVVDEASQVARLRYVLAQGCQEGLVDSPLAWPGLHCARALLGREELVGIWLDRSALYHARRDRGGTVDAAEFETRYPVTLTPLPCWAGMSADEYRAQCAAMVAEIADEARRTNAALGRVPMGARHVLAQHPHSRPRRTNRSPAPLVHAATRRARDVFKAMYRRFVDSFRAAAERLRAGVRDVEFPMCSFPPGAPFVAGGAGAGEWLAAALPP
jgi:REP element-mobilizing transposase RayT